MIVTTTLRAGPFAIQHYYRHRYDEQWVWVYTTDSGQIAHLHYKTELAAVDACERENGKQTWTRVGLSTDTTHATESIGVVYIQTQSLGSLAETLRAALAECEAYDRGLR